MEENKIVKILGCLALVLLVALGCLKVFNNKSNMPNPLIEVKTKNELKKYINFEVPVMNKEIDSYIVIGSGRVYDHVRVLYTDKSEFDIGKLGTDVSGIYGAESIKKEKINKIDVEFFKYNSLYFMTFSDKKHSYSYLNKKEIEDSEAKEVIDLIK